MPEKTELEFEVVRGGAPTVVRVTRKDGSVYEVKIAVALMGVKDTGGTDNEGKPAFELQATFPVMVEKVEQ